MEKKSGAVNELVHLETEVASLATAMRGLDTNIEKFVNDTNSAISQLSTNIADVARITQDSITKLSAGINERDREFQQQINQSSRTNWSVIFSGASVFVVIIAGFVTLALFPINENQKITADILGRITERTYEAENKQARLQGRVEAGEGRVTGIRSTIDLQNEAQSILNQTKFKAIHKEIDALNLRIDRGFNQIYLEYSKQNP